MMAAILIFSFTKGWLSKGPVLRKAVWCRVFCPRSQLIGIVRYLKSAEVLLKSEENTTLEDTSIQNHWKAYIEHCHYFALS